MVVAPTATPAPGNYETAQEVSLSSETVGAVIYYTLDETTPTTASTLYTDPIHVSTVENTRNRFEHLLKALNPESQTFRKPAGANGVCYAYQIGGEKPASGAEIGKTRFSRKTSLVVTHIEADKGKRVFYSVCYENAKGDKGPWSLVEEAYIG